MDGVFWIKAIQMVASLSLLVIIHEFGHFLFSRLFHTRVEKFYAFFNPRFSIMRCKKIKGKWQFKFFAPNVPDSYDKQVFTNPEGKEAVIYTPIDISKLPEDDWRCYPESTEFGIGWLPLGGYCKIAGMIDESMDSGSLQQEPQPWEFRTKNAWQRLLIMAGGVLFNVIFAFILYSMLILKNGETYIPLQDLKYGLEFNEQAKRDGFADGDIILSVDGKCVKEYDAHFWRKVVSADNVVVLREGKEITIPIPETLTLFDFTSSYPYMSIYMPMVIDSVLPGGPADLRGLRAGDLIVDINGHNVSTWTKFQNQIEAMRQSEKENVVSHKLDITIDRPGEGLINTNIVSDANFRFGIVHRVDAYSIVTDNYNVLQCIPQGIRYGWRTLCGYVSDFQYVFTKEGAKNLGGFGSIGSIFPSSWDWTQFFTLTALLSIVLAFMNVLPIPALDGGYILFLLFEIITRRKPSDKFMERAVSIGMVLMLALLIWANMNDVLRFFQR